MSLKIERTVPRDNPPTTPHQPQGGKKRPNTTGKRLWSVLKILIDGSLSLKEPAPHPPTTTTKKQSTMPVLFPLHIYTLDSKPCSQKVENRYDKTWLEKMTSVHLEYCTLNKIHSNTQGQKHCLLQVSYGIIIYSKNGHVPRLNL